MRRGVLLVLAGVVACEMTSGANAQVVFGTGLGHPQSSRPNDRTARLFFTLTNADGSPVTGLKSGNFATFGICDASIYPARVQTNVSSTRETEPGDYFITVEVQFPSSRACDGFIVKVGDRAPIGSVIRGSPAFIQRGSFVVRTASPMPLIPSHD